VAIGHIDEFSEREIPNETGGEVGGDEEVSLHTIVSS